MSSPRVQTERIYFEPTTVGAPPISWWARYSAQLTGLSATARAALEADCRYILDRGIFGAGPPTKNCWPTRTRTGLVVGSVQSGKTASMLGVSAMGLDHGVDVLVVLAGTRISLWRQTYERLVNQLDWGDSTAKKNSRRLLCPSPGVVDSDGHVTLDALYALAPAAVERRLKRQQPILVVAMKQIDHLHALAKNLRENMFSVAANLDRPVHMLIVDDEADDGSILDAAVEEGLDPANKGLKQIPRGIANLWANPLVPENVYSTYIAYTATPQANLLQEGHNPLAPHDFLVALRTPLDTGYPVDPYDPIANMSAPRSSNYPEPEGLARFYTGGEFFYRRNRDAELCLPTTNSRQDDLAEALRAFLVAGAIRLHRDQRMGPHSALSAFFSSRHEALEKLSKPHAMLFHPSAAIDEHFAGAEDILLWAGVPDRDQARLMLESSRAGLPEALVKKLFDEESRWSVWLNRYRESARSIEAEFNVFTPVEFPEWETVRELLVKEIIPGTRVAVVNSSPSADDRPEYDPSYDADTDLWQAPRDLSTIFVSGNVMARGLTLEGLTTTLFERSSNNPYADTQMQMQRWFGYRGSYGELCRVFADTQQLRLFAAYHDIDEAVRVAILERMQHSAPDPGVLHGLNFLATGKIANLGTTPLSPGAKPFISLLNSGERPDPNAALLADLFSQRASADLCTGDTVRGRILTESLSLAEAADLLTGLRYNDYAPGTSHRIAELWAQVQERVDAVAPTGDGDFYRAPSGLTHDDPVRVDCPFSIPAYLRLWEACLTRPVRGLFVTGSPGATWSTVDLTGKQQTQPRFWVGIRYGMGPKITKGPLASLPFDIPATCKSMENGELATEWGTNNPTANTEQYRGDVFFDHYHHRSPILVPPDGPQWRPIGADGLILFYVNQLPAQPYPNVAVGVALPAGGPEQFAATKANILNS